MHTLGYNHVDTPAEQQACATAHGRASYYEFGEPSAPYIYDSCAHHLIDYSESVCSGGVKSCPPGQLRLRTSWTGKATDSQSGTACSCYRDPRHVVALRTHNTGQTVTAMNGGGGELRTNWATASGAWQWMYVYDFNGGNWSSGDHVRVRTFSGHNWRRNGGTIIDAVTTSATNSVFSFNRFGGGQIGNGSQVNIRTPLYFNDWVRDGGTALRLVINEPTDNSHRFHVVEPSREHLVYIRSPHQESGQYRYVDFDPNTSSSFAWNRALRSDLTSNDIDREVATAFWIVDWNGGQLMHNDLVSLQRYGYDSYDYLSTPDTGHARFANGVGQLGYQTFRIRRHTAGSGAVQHNDTITLESVALGTYLTAMPHDYFDYQIRCYGVLRYMGRSLAAVPGSVC